MRATYLVYVRFGGYDEVMGVETAESEAIAMAERYASGHGKRYVKVEKWTRVLTACMLQHTMMKTSIHDKERKMLNLNATQLTIVEGLIKNEIRDTMETESLTYNEQYARLAELFALVAKVESAISAITISLDGDVSLDEDDFVLEHI